MREIKTYDTWEWLCHAGRTHNGYEWANVQHHMIGIPKTALKMKSVWSTQFVIERLEVDFKKPLFDLYIYHLFKPEYNEFVKYGNTCEVSIKIKSDYIQKDILVKDLNKWPETLDLKLLHKNQIFMQKFASVKITKKGQRKSGDIYYCPLVIDIEQKGSEWFHTDWAVLAVSAI